MRDALSDKAENQIACEEGSEGDCRLSLNPFAPDVSLLAV